MSGLNINTLSTNNIVYLNGFEDVEYTNQSGSIIASSGKIIINDQLVSFSQRTIDISNSFKNIQQTTNNRWYYVVAKPNGEYEVILCKRNIHQAEQPIVQIDQTGNSYSILVNNINSDNRRPQVVNFIAEIKNSLGESLGLFNTLVSDDQITTFTLLEPIIFPENCTITFYNIAFTRGFVTTRESSFEFFEPSPLYSKEKQGCYINELGHEDLSGEYGKIVGLFFYRNGSIMNFKQVDRSLVKTIENNAFERAVRLLAPIQVDQGNWFTRSFGPTSGRTIAFSPAHNRLVFGSNNGTSPLHYSDDGGLNFIVATMTGGFPSVIVQKVMWVTEFGMFVALAESGTNRVWTSPDGIVWTQQAIPFANAWTSMAYSESLGMIVAVSRDGATQQRVMTSLDGTNWALRTTLVEMNQPWQCVARSDDHNLFVAVSSMTASFPAPATLGQNIMTSPDGIDWTLRDSPSFGGSMYVRAWRSICYSRRLKMFVAVASVGVLNGATIATDNRAMYSFDGINWLIGNTPIARNPPHPNNPTEPSWQSVFYSEKMQMFVAVAGSANESTTTAAVGTFRLMTSVDGINWRSRSTANDGSTWNDVIWDDRFNQWIVVGNATTMVSGWGLGIGA